MQRISASLFLGFKVEIFRKGVFRINVVSQVQYVLDNLFYISENEATQSHVAHVLSSSI